MYVCIIVIIMKGVYITIHTIISAKEGVANDTVNNAPKIFSVLAISCENAPGSC